MISIKKATAKSLKGNLVLLGADKSAFSQSGFSKAELDYITRQIEQNDKKFVAINQYHRWVFLQVLDEKKDSSKDRETARKAGSNLAVLLHEHKLDELSIENINCSKEVNLAFAEGIALSAYRFLKYKKEARKEKHPLKSLAIANSKVSEKDIERLGIAVEATCIARDLVNEPLVNLSAVQLAEEIKKLGKEAGFKVEVFNKQKIEALKMGGLLAVNRGSMDPPTFSILEWNPSNAKNKKPYILVGKGVVFDTGGLSLKPTPNSMDLMKSDMAGAAAVASTLYAIAKSKLPVHVIGLIPATDNRPGQDAYVPGDVITMHNGTTVEVLNTDAEGRLILADALSYAKKYKPELVIDLATLTGAATAAIGTFGIVAMGNSDKAMNTLKESGNNVYERIAEMPFWDEYDELIKSDVAEIKNVGGPHAGSITAGKFLARFTDYPWIHFDIAGPAFLAAKDSYRSKGGTGVGVRLLFDFFQKLVA